MANGAVGNRTQGRLDIEPLAPSLAAPAASLPRTIFSECGTTTCRPPVAPSGRCAGRSNGARRFPILIASGGRLTDSRAPLRDNMGANREQSKRAEEAVASTVHLTHTRRRLPSLPRNRGILWRLGSSAPHFQIPLKRWMHSAVFVVTKPDNRIIDAVVGIR